jgi:HKD family nuclease
VLIIQDPTNVDSPVLLESFKNALSEADSIRGMFAFASSPGVRLFTEHEGFQQIVIRGAVEVIVGTDAVTNNRALDALMRVATQFPNFRARAFLNPKPEGLFHPKFCFTKKQGGGHLIAGSGNLTEGGLLSNWEAYSFDELNNERIEEVQATWDVWAAKHDAYLLPLDNPRIRERVSLNTVLAREGDLPLLTAVSETGSSEDPETEQLIPNNAEVLIAEIPASSDRWKQANFDLVNFRNFFGVRDDAANRLWAFRHINADGTLEPFEPPRPPVPVKSQNYRFELAAASGFAYPDLRDGRPIGVFVRMTARTFFYRLLMPNDSEYETVRNILVTRAGPNHRVDRMRRERFTIDELRHLWPDSPLWRLPAAP